jgi:protein phosphatase-4 regulatory subunit 3
MNYLKLLIDPENMMAVSIGEKTEFLTFFYFRSMSVLLAPLMANSSDLKLARDDFHIAQLQNLILDFVTFCVEHHTYHMRNFLNKKDLLRRVLVLLKSKHQFLQLSKYDLFYYLFIAMILFLRCSSILKENYWFKR